MIKEIALFLKAEVAYNQELTKKHIAQKMGISASDITEIRIRKRSIDARKNIRVFCKFEVWIGETCNEQISSPDYKDVQKEQEVYIAGAGPAGLFAALELIVLGYKPVIFERGKMVSERKTDIASLNRGIELNSDSNYCFGEGGAGTFSDGKLYTRSTKRGNTQKALEILHLHGASADVLFESHPHIGSDKLPGIIASIRQTILKYGGEIHYNKTLTDIRKEFGSINQIVLKSGESISAKALILATGHSARDVYEMLHNNGIKIEPKAYAIGVRVEHLQRLVNEAQYQNKDGSRLLPPATYSLKHQVGGRGVFSFCMCPGGQIVPAMTAVGEIVLNGMSNSGRTGKYANSGIVVTVSPNDFMRFGDNPLAGMHYQQAIEQKAALFTKSLKAPAQRISDFLRKKNSGIVHQGTYKPGIVCADLHELFPEEISEPLRMALYEFGKKLRGFSSEEAMMLAPETRTSSPVRIPRCDESYMHPEIAGFFPCGEGAGYAGGILSSAVDGLNIAEKVDFYLRKQ